MLKRKSVKSKTFNQKSTQYILASLIIFLLVFSIYLAKNENISVSNSTTGKKLPIYSVETDQKRVALSFDAAWGNEDISTILDILKKHNVTTTFFMTGEWVEKYPEDVKKLYDAGHDLGNHSENHKYMSQLNDEECIQELQKVHDKVKNLTGVEMNLFRPPYGDYNNSVLKNANSCNYYVVQQNVDSLDWKDYGVDSIVRIVTGHKNLKNGSIILMHNGAKYTKDALEGVILGLQEQGYEIVPVSELIYTENYHMNHEGRQIKD